MTQSVRAFISSPMAQTPSTSTGDLGSLLRYREVLINLVQADLKLRYRRTLLGYSWALLYPLATMAIMTLVFARAMGFESWQNYTLFVFAGLLPWNFLISAMWGAGYSIVYHEDLLKKIYLPKHLFPLAVTMARFADFLFNFVVLFFIIGPIVHYHPSWALLQLPLAILMLVVFMTGVAFAIATLNVFVRDTTHLMSVTMQLGFYLTPIIYDANSDKVPARFRFVFEINPMTHIVRPFQDIISAGIFPSTEHLAAAAAISLATFVLGYAIYSSLQRQLIFRL
jgi:lipopolysaccharide transport system permease protein